MSLLASFAPATIPSDAQAIRAEVRAFLAATLPPRPAAVRARTWTGWDADFSRALAHQGWVGLTMPTDLGGAGLTPWHRFVLVEELLVAGAPIAAHWIGDRQSAPLLRKFGTAEQQQRYIPAICRSELFFCIGMSEPNAGSDLASVRTRAVRTDSGWRLTGRKIWTTHAHRADLMIALVRTSGTPDDRQKGLSQFLVDLRAPGVSIRPIPLITGDSEFSEVTFDDVDLPDDALVGAEGNGWAQVNAELAFERSGPERIYSSTILLDLWARTLSPASDSRDLELLGRLTARLATLRAMSIALTARLAAGESPVVEAALFKDLGTGFEQSIPALLADRIAADADPELLTTLAYLQQLSPVFTLRGGTREILRGMIARGLGLR
ncbi:MAG: acyl-CoA dehydrogenase family protein [Sandaracinobacter sp.]